MSNAASRRHLLRAAGAAAALIPLGAMAPLRPARDSSSGVPICRVANTRADLPAGPLKKLKLTWNANAICTVGVPVAETRGIFAKHGLDVETSSSAAAPTSCWRRPAPGRPTPASAWRGAG